MTDLGIKKKKKTKHKQLNKHLGKHPPSTFPRLTSIQHFSPFPVLTSPWFLLLVYTQFPSVPLLRQGQEQEVGAVCDMVSFCHSLLHFPSLLMASSLFPSPLMWVDHSCGPMGVSPPRCGSPTAVVPQQSLLWQGTHPCQSVSPAMSPTMTPAMAHPFLLTYFLICPLPTVAAALS